MYKKNPEMCCLQLVKTNKNIEIIPAINLAKKRNITFLLKIIYQFCDLKICE